MSQQLTRGKRVDRTDPDDVDPVRVESDSESGLTATVFDTIHGIEPNRWNGVVDGSDLGTVFHRYEWLEAIETGIGYPARHVVVEKDSNPIGLFPNFVVDIPKTPFERLTSVYPGFGGPLLTTDVSESLSLLLDLVPELCSGRTVVHEVRACNTNFLRYDEHMSARGYDSERLEGRFLLNLEKGYDDLRAEMDSSKRRAIRRGRETDHEIVEEELTRSNLRRFYQKYCEHMTNVGGTIYPVAFFEQLAAMDDRVLLLTLRLEGEYAGGFLELLDDEQSSVHGFFSGLPAEYFEYHASELLYDYLFRWAIENGYETYDFGGAGANFEDGAFRFKEEFGGDLVPNVYWERGTSPFWRLIDVGRSLYGRYDK
ncbi:GNAT family N-acetyltransferase [Halobiforma nitratireducens]|uniref:GNAT family N-acetyltransferase n=1 Tax=Halobiforma nitratireducens TaxID=130048 RepID=UPI000677C88C|nr:GNAT family N-acetyltransferase [Halobiforma nitratireducens]